MDYSEAESDTEHENTLSCSSSSTSVVDSPVKRENSGELGDLWTPNTIASQAERVSEQCRNLSERTKQRAMAQQGEMTAMERMLEMMLRSERDRAERDEKKEREERK